MTTDDQRSRRPSQAENPPLVRVGLNRLLGGVCLAFEPAERKQRFVTRMALPYIQLGVTSNSVVCCFDGDDFSVSHTMG